MKELEGGKQLGGEKARWPVNLFKLRGNRGKAYIDVGAV